MTRVLPQPHDLCLTSSTHAGGDIQHTHLVKGLDMSLLAKARDDERAAAAAAARVKDKEGGGRVRELANLKVGCDVLMCDV